MVNSDTKNPSQDIIKHAIAPTAVIRWTIRNSMKTELVNSLLEISGRNHVEIIHLMEAKKPIT